MEITKVDKHLAAEFEILAREYSPMREANPKWVYFQQPIVAAPSTLYTVSTSDTSEEDYVTIFRPNSTLSYSFLIHSLQKRLSIKRNASLLNAINSFWTMLNPFHIRGVSKEVYIKISEFLYFNVLNRVNDIATARQYAEKDAATDFEERNYIVFADFYDSIFELLDSTTKSLLVSEYIRLVKNFEKLIRGATWFSAMNLHNKLHLKDDDLTRVSLKPWMIKILNFSDKVDKLPELLRDSRSTSVIKPGPSNLTERFYHSRKRSVNDNVQVHIKRFTQLGLKTSQSRTLTRTLSRTSSQLRLNTQRSSTKDSRFPSNERQKSLHLQKVSPLSISHSKLSQRPRDLLERIIEGRKNFVSTIIEANKARE